MERDMTVGSPGKMILQFTFPLFIGNVFQQLYNMADTIIVGKFVGANALAAVGSTGTIMFLIIGFLQGLTAGFTVPTAQKFGAGDLKSMRKTVGSAVILSAGVSVVMTVISMLGMKSLLHLLNTPSDIFDDAYAYIMVICGGIFAQVLYNLLASILRALGNSKIPLYFLILAAGLNVVLDLLFIVVFHMGAVGAAYATVISQGVSGMLCLIYIIKKVPVLKMEKNDWKMKGHLVKIQFGVGFPMALQYSITAIGSMMMQSALNILGSVVIAGFTAGSKIEQLVTQAYVALGTTMATYSAQNMGAGKVDRIRKGFKNAMIIGTVYSVVTSIFVMTVGKYLTPLFLSENLGQIMGYVDIYLKCVGLFFIPLAVVNIFRNGIQGMGYGLLPMMAGVAELIGRGVVAIFASEKKSYVGVCMASPAAWILAGGLLLIMYYFIMKNIKYNNEKKR
ncbi:MAG: MATE family efflux transporter [Lachnospiraceae bacterium]|nr:MATE family efflux transporter [Lachnospiraceae bacterium]